MIPQSTTHLIKLASVFFFLPLSQVMANESSKVTNQSKSLYHQPLHHIIVGGYASVITTLQYDESTQKLSKIGVFNNSLVGTSPSWMEVSSDGKILHISNEVAEVDGQNNTGSISCYRIIKNTHSGSDSNSSISFEPINQAFTSSDPVAFDISPDRKNMIVASYTGATASRYELNEDQSFKYNKSVQAYSYNATGPNIARQLQSYIHQARYDPTGRIATFTDLGGDRVYIHSVDNKTGELNPIDTIQLKAGTGPRHLTFFVVNETRTDVYLICELSNELIYIQFNSISNPSFSTELKQILPTLPSTIYNQTTFGAGEVAITNDGQFVYGTNRQTDFNKSKDDNSIVLFKRDKLTGLLSERPILFPLSHTGFTPRHCSFSKDLHQRFLVVVGQQDHLVGIYERDVLNGQIKFLDMISIDEPAYVEFL
ncbi:uncharacterized protein MELLADRAFT_116595 [Melampsora larici-populina 98AG31]|uniref:3-carboxymuconate cyclase n=1 Tax=Melampsora larici-populina (strain 98AG31 / pathotype 3-4-7) TaxID=747676 RepID=F4RN01_MELLP|nr:uncharacterized protein MELLADRAFT_116595 [Melampsora larici-populina 98AG31]EGG06211.1 hypothetical protein MELLADRAFT_116595 [Melampsora larici-populina 98AG31]